MKLRILMMKDNSEKLMKKYRNQRKTNLSKDEENDLCFKRSE
jgi:hypothetical protein